MTTSKRRRKPQVTLDPKVVKKNLMESIAEKQAKTHEEERIRLTKFIRKDECHAHLATRIYRYKHSFAPAKTYKQVADDLKVITEKYLQAVTTRLRNLSHSQFMLVHKALYELETELGLSEMPQGFWEE